MQLTIERIVERERKKKPKISNLTSSERLKGIKDNRTEERKLERQRTAIGLKEKVTNEHKANVIDLKIGTSLPDLEYPSLDTYLEEEEDD